MSDEMKRSDELLEKIKRDWENPVFQSIGKIWYQLKMKERLEKKETFLNRICDYMNFAEIEVFFVLAGFLYSKHGFLAGLCCLICIIFGAILLGNIKCHSKRYKYIEKKAKEKIDE